jgi:hypothetical protein
LKGKWVIVVKAGKSCPSAKIEDVAMAEKAGKVETVTQVVVYFACIVISLAMIGIIV